MRNQLKLDIKICLVKNGYPPQYSPEVFSKVMEQVENFEEYSGTIVSGKVTPISSGMYEFETEKRQMAAAKDTVYYGTEDE